MAIIYYLVWEGNDNIWDGCEFNYTVIVIKVVLIQPYLFFNLMICNFFQGCNALLIAALSFVNW